MKVRNNRGIALIVVILAICAVVPVVIDLQRTVRGGAYESLNTADRIKLNYMAHSGFNIGQAVIMAQEEKPFTSLIDRWANIGKILSPNEALFPTGKVRITVEDELGKIPLNMLVSGKKINGDLRALLMRLLCLPEFGLTQEKAEEIVAAMIDWIDADEEVSPGGAESSYYRSLSVPYEAKNAPLDDLYELLMVKGVTHELFYGNSNRLGLKDLLTLHGTGKININTAPITIIRVLAKEMTIDLAREMDLYRRNEFNDLSDVMWYKNVKGMAEVSISRDLITTKSNVFRIVSEASLERMKVRIISTVERDGTKRPKLLAYRWER